MTSPAPIRVMIVDDHEVVRRGIVSVLDATRGLTVVGEAAGVQEAQRRLPAVRPDVLVCDLQLPDGTGIDVMRAAREHCPEQKMLVLTSFDDRPAIEESRRVGAAGLMLKSSRSQEIAQAVRTIAEGGGVWPPEHEEEDLPLGTTEKRIASLIGDGLSNREIAEQLGLAEKTVKNRITTILATLGLQRRTQVVAREAARRRAGWK